MVKANHYKISSFPDGTPLIKKDLTINYLNVISIVWTFESMAELPTVIMIAKDAKDNGADVELFMPYIPNARMDRAYHDEDVFTLKWFADEINRCGFSCVTVFDPHSDVAPALIDRCEVHTPIREICQAIEESKPDVIYFPDAGAMKRYEETVYWALERVKCNAYIIHGDKKRDWATGKILGLDVVGEVKPGEKVLMIDDICSYGGTMFYSAKKLKELGAGDIDMYVSHCENSILDSERGHLFDDPELIHMVYTTDSIGTRTDMEVWALDIHFNTDGDFGWRLAPVAMTYNANNQFYRLSVVREVKNDVEKRQVIAEFNWILEQLIKNLYTTREYVSDYVEEMLNDSLGEEWKEDFYHELSGNYDGSYVQFRIHTSKDKMSFKVNCTREEYEKIQKKYGDCLGIDGRQVVKELLKG